MTRHTRIFTVFFIFLATLAGLTCAPAVLANTPSVTPPKADIHYDFSAASIDGSTIKNLSADKYHALFQGKAKAATVDGHSVAQFDGRNSAIKINGSEGLHIGDNGLSIVTTVKIADRAGATNSAPETLDMFLWKKNEYLFGRSRKFGGTENQLYANIFGAGADWGKSARSYRGGDLPAGEWVHLALILKRNNMVEQGNVGYLGRLFVNGKEIATKEIRELTSARTRNPVTIGQGWGGPWTFRGEMADMRIYKRALTDMEFRSILEAETIAPVEVKRRAEADPEYQSLVESIGKKAVSEFKSGKPERLQLLSAIQQAAINVKHQNELVSALKALQALPSSKSMPAELAKAATGFAFISNPKAGLAFYTNKDGLLTVCSFFDKVQGKEILGDMSPLWSLEGDIIATQKALKLQGDDATLVSAITVSGNKATLTWTKQASDDSPLAFVAKATLTLNGLRLTAAFNLDNQSPAVALREVLFPRIAIRRLNAETDTLLVPSQSGELSSPTNSYTTMYPQGHGSMQFFAYYDDKRGIYLGHEDPTAQSKTFTASGFNEQEGSFGCRWYVGAEPNKGGNDFATSGHTAIELFEGNWFDASQIYKRFAKTAKWWPASHERKDTAPWLRSNTVWMRWDAKKGWNGADDIIAFQKYLEIPMAVHLYSWDLTPHLNWPIFKPKPGFDDMLKKMQSANVRIKPYLDVRLWDMNEPTYNTKGVKSAVKRKDGSVPTEKYSMSTFAVMNPANAQWTQIMQDLLRDSSKLGADGLYLDQLGAGTPIICFDESHGQPVGSGKTWQENGYWKMLEPVLTDLRKQYPNQMYDMEDAAEAFLHLTDGVLPWRYNDAKNRVPAFQAVYAGRTQFNGRNGWRGITMFPKAATQMLTGEQIGWFRIHDIKPASRKMFRLFVKKLAHTRLTFLPFFNSGDMAKPLETPESMRLVSGDWGHRGPIIDSTPAVLNGVWTLGDNTLVLLVNTIGEPTAFPVHGKHLVTSGTYQLTHYSEGKEAAQQGFTPDTKLNITVPGYGISALVIGPDKTSTPAMQLVHTDAAKLMMNLKRFETDVNVDEASKIAEYDKADPWYVPNTAPKSGLDWIYAHTAPKISGAQGNEAEKTVGHVMPKASLSFGPIDFGTGDAKELYLEIEVAKPASQKGGGITFYHIEQPGSGKKGKPIGSALIMTTPDWNTYKVQRIALPKTIQGIQNIVVAFNGRKNGVCNFKRWRVVRH